ncbi:11399_t:CDS:2 [Funneliformis geosporum]|uniref:7759_t:CDS:1 n=1 Tax=Funneliformis geosporum TaxID=1117311 RepID=A0A9W4SCK1_9GLOM|nr:11399_t:CDS:2 [Funneliformis geosporum]CAI2164769.1 7759_t:CDS:2 [Funneliformis geosporum]
MGDIDEIPGTRRRAAARTTEVREQLLDNGDSNFQQRRIKRQRSPMTSRIFNAIIWTTIAFVFSWYFELSQGIHLVLENSWTRKSFYLSLFALLNIVTIFIYLQYYIPFKKDIPPPNYGSWDFDDSLKKFIPIATILGVICVMGLFISLWNICGFFGTSLTPSLSETFLYQ